MMDRKPSSSNRRVLTVFMLAMINVAAIASLRNLPMMADTGLALVFFIVVAALIFFIPAALVSAELATGWPKTGNFGMWLVAGVGTLGSLFAIAIGFFPPSQFEIGNITFYEAFLISVILIMCAAPFIIHHLRKPSWVPAPASEKEEKS